MRVLLFGNKPLAARVAATIRSRDDELVGVVLHPEPRRDAGDAILEAAGIDAARAIDGSRLETPEVLETIERLRPEIGLSVLFGYILRPGVRRLFSEGCVNLHPGYLPYNRGAYPNVWSIVERTPAGATLHYVDDGIDTGDIIEQSRVEVLPTDTGETLYRRLEQACFEVFERAWPLVREGRAARTPQTGAGTSHRVRDVESIDEIHLDRSYRAADLLDLLRARTFPPHLGTFIRVGGKRVNLRLQLEKE
jgi:methionyl-tRNA formyltransferase